MSNNFDLRKYLQKGWLFESNLREGDWRETYKRMHGSLEGYPGPYDDDDYVGDGYDDGEDRDLKEAGQKKKTINSFDQLGNALKDSEKKSKKQSEQNREIRAQRGNWRGSVGRWFLEHKDEVDKAFYERKLKDFLVNVAIPAQTSKEAKNYLQHYVLERPDGQQKSDYQVYYTLVNAFLRGEGLGVPK